MQPSPQSFDPVLSINSGQVFLWEKYNGIWYGVYGEHIIKVRKDKEQSIELSSFPEMQSCEEKIFRLDDNINEIVQQLSHDPFVDRLIKKYTGLRLMRQEPHQCLFSFVCASNTNIPMIRRMLYALTKKFGREVQVDGKIFFTFPSASDISKATLIELKSCGLGYRAGAVKSAADWIVSGRLDFDLLKKGRYEESKLELLKIYGVGNKIADCVLLFSLEKLEAFPIDIWITRALANHYNWLYNNKLKDKAVTSYQYAAISKCIREYFGKYAGYAQQYIYYHMRQDAGKKW